jgi:predicted ArsR family transcriptional regulator
LRWMTDMKRQSAGSRADGTRARILALLRESAWTVDDLAARLGVTDNAVRFHLDALEREGTAAKEGLRRTGGAGQPATLYSLTAHGDEGFSRAYAPVLIASLAELREQMSTVQLLAFLQRVGRRLAVDRPRPGASLASRVNSAAGLLNALGGVTSVEKSGDDFFIVGKACPLSRAVEADHCVCSAVTALVAEVAGAQVTERCDRSGRPKCCFEVSSGSKPRAIAHG